MSCAPPRHLGACAVQTTTEREQIYVDAGDVAGQGVSFAPFVEHSLHVEVAVRAPRSDHVVALEASIPKQASPPSSVIRRSTLRGWPSS